MKDFSRLLELSSLFIKLGLIGFGGPPSTIAMMENEAVRRRHWLTRESFLEMLATTNLVPGPNATEMAAHIGFARAGFSGLLTAAISFILPGSLISLILAIFYRKYGAIPQIQSIFDFINPIVAAILISACLRLGKEMIGDYKKMLIGIGSLFAALMGLEEIPILLASGGLAIFLFSDFTKSFLPTLIILSANHSHVLVLEQHKTGLLTQLWFFFFKAGALLFGSTYILIAFIQRDVVDKYHWLTQQQMLEAIAIGQITPGPISTTATFIGYLVADLPGALLATIGIFLPSFFIVLLVSHMLPQINQNRMVSDFLKGVTASSVALIVFVTIGIFRSTISDFYSLSMVLVSAVLLIKYNLDPFWLILSGIALGLIKVFVT